MAETLPATGSAVITPTTKPLPERPGARWLFPEPVPADAAETLSRELGLPAAAARILVARGLTDPAAAERFLSPRLADLHDPFLLRDMDRAVARIREAIARRESIEIHGDYDVDGITSTVLLKKTLEIAGANPTWRIPHRLNDGYGMQPAAIEDAARRGVQLIVSVDNGTRANAALARARELGLDVIVTDHHLPEAELPPAVALINPSRADCTYPNPNLCGAGVAFKLAHAILGGLGWSEAKLARVLESLLKLVAIATVADIVPLTGENRVIVKHGLSGLGEVRNIGLRALLEKAGFADRIPDATEVAFRIAPAINASGRMDDAGEAVRMFLTEDPAEAANIAERLFELNRERQAAENAMVHEILALCEEAPVTSADAALVFWGEGWHRGVAGIVASRMVERYHRPAVVLGVEDGVAQGSGRSISQFHLLDALESMREIFTRFGGHAHAAGVTLPAENIDEFRERLRACAAARLTSDDMRPEVRIDAVVDLSEVNDALWLALERMAPFGLDNPKPRFALCDVELAAPPRVWKEKHLRLSVRRRNHVLPMKAWRQAHLAGELAGVSRVDVVFEMDRGWQQGWDPIARDCRASTHH